MHGPIHISVQNCMNYRPDFCTIGMIVPSEVCTFGIECLCQQRLCVRQVKTVNTIYVFAVSRHSKSRFSLVSKTEVKVTLYAAMKAHGGKGGGYNHNYSLLFNLSARWVCVVTHRPQSLHICVKRLVIRCIGGAKELSVQVGNILPQQGSDPESSSP